MASSVIAGFGPRPTHVTFPRFSITIFLCLPCLVYRTGPCYRRRQTDKNRPGRPHQFHIMSRVLLKAPYMQGWSLRLRKSVQTLQRATNTKPSFNCKLMKRRMCILTMHNTVLSCPVEVEIVSQKSKKFQGSLYLSKLGEICLVPPPLLA